MQRLVDPDPDWNGAFKTAPDGSAFFIVTTRGNLQTGTNDYSLKIYFLDDVHAFVNKTGPRPEPRELARFSSSSNRPAISSPQWSAHTNSIYFLAETPDTLPQLFAADTKTGDTRQLTTFKGGVWSYDVVNNMAILTTRSSPPDNAALSDSIAGYTVKEDDLQSLALLTSNGTTDRHTYYKTIILDLDNNEYTKVVEAPAALTENSKGLWLSPDGTKAVAIRPVAQPPSLWNDYQHPRPTRKIHIPDASSDREWTNPKIAQFVLIDLDDHSVTPIVAAPTGAFVDVATAPHALWHTDGQSVVLVNTLLPIYPDSEVVDSSAYAVQVDLKSGNLTPITKLKSFWVQKDFARVTGVQWHQSNDNILEVRSADVNGPLPSRLFRRNEKGWVVYDEADAQPSMSSALELSVHEALNTPPEIVAHDPHTGAKTQLSKLNPDFRHINFQKADIFRWTDAEGTKWTAGLLKPAGYLPQKSYPLVIQMHGFWPNKYMLDGSHTLSGGAFTTGQAAQALAAKGMMVLQLEDRFEHRYTPHEARSHMLGIESAIAALAKKGIVDLERIGLSGFSRAGYYAKYTLAHSDTKFKAALISDSVDRGYMSYLMRLNAPLPNDQQEYRTMNGGNPVTSDGIKNWLAQVPAFNIYNVSTPVRLEAIGWPSMLSQWEFYAGLKLREQKVQMTYYPAGVHILVKPLERWRSQQGAVDWFNCWLNQVDPVTDICRKIRSD